MFIRNAAEIKGFASEHGEVVREMIGAAAGGTTAYSLAEITLPPGKRSRKHYHPVAEESFYILSGAAQIEVDGQTAALAPGDSIAVLPNQVHQIANTGPDDLVFLAVCVPAWTPDNSVYLG
ncbi:MAG: cupin domain-containing protein [Chloroflexi bacterium]|nr:cupin domain-containing protein [Chloroflexota bacterium]